MQPGNNVSKWEELRTSLRCNECKHLSWSPCDCSIADTSNTWCARSVLFQAHYILKYVTYYCNTIWYIIIIHNIIWCICIYIYTHSTCIICIYVTVYTYTYISVIDYIYTHRKALQPKTEGEGPKDCFRNHGVTVEDSWRFNISCLTESISLSLISLPLPSPQGRWTPGTCWCLWNLGFQEPLGASPTIRLLIAEMTRSWSW